MSVLPVILGLPLVLLPAHIALLHLIIEPTSSIAFEIERPASDIMQKKPRPLNEPLFNNEIWHTSLLRGTFLLSTLASIYFLSLGQKQSEADTRTLVFTALILANSILIFLSSGPKMSLKNKFKTRPDNIVLWLIIASLVMLGLVLYIPILREVFRFSFLHPKDILICVLATLISAILCELILGIYHKKNNN
jgi:Ca2+-transporting ATPase